MSPGHPTMIKIGKRPSLYTDHPDYETTHQSTQSSGYEQLPTPRRSLPGNVRSHATIPCSRRVDLYVFVSLQCPSWGVPMTIFRLVTLFWCARILTLWKLSLVTLCSRLAAIRLRIRSEPPSISPKFWKDTWTIMPMPSPFVTCLIGT
jgi:hypothetical protein